MGRLWKQAASREVMKSKISKGYKYSQEDFEVKVEWREGYKNYQQLGNICVFNTRQYFLSRLRKKCKDCNPFLQYNPRYISEKIPHEKYYRQCLLR
jgi:hypothetical protein